MGDGGEGRRERREGKGKKRRGIFGRRLKKKKGLHRVVLYSPHIHYDICGPFQTHYTHIHGMGTERQGVIRGSTMPKSESTPRKKL